MTSRKWVYPIFIVSFHGIALVSNAFFPDTKRVRRYESWSKVLTHILLTGSRSLEAEATGECSDIYWPKIKLYFRATGGVKDKTLISITNQHAKTR
ncbi:hypothetical protein F5Y03DRAFT_348041 [Xylaria venustula]|nr:hypothetical protein F5Y03DRAFT_348041 [Xylaria venustula]